MAQRIAASDERVAFGRSIQLCSGGKYDECTGDESDAAYSGPLGGELDALPGCGSTPSNVDVSGEVVAYMSYCATGVTVRDFSLGASPSWRTFPSENDGRIAGPYLAVDLGRPDQLPVNDAVIVVYDWRDGHEVYRVDAPAQGLPSFDIRDDGTLVFSRSTSTDLDHPAADLYTASPQDPKPHLLAHQVDGEIRIGTDRVAYGGYGSYTVLDLAGHEVAHVRDPAAPGDSFDFDGQRLAWATQPCEVTAAVVWDLTGAPPALPSGACPLARAPHLRADLRHRRLSLTLACPLKPVLGCTGSAYIQLAGEKYAHVLVGVLLGPGERKSSKLRLSKHQVCRLARARDTRATVEVSSFTRRPPTHSDRKVRLRVSRTGRPRGCRAVRPAWGSGA